MRIVNRKKTSPRLAAAASALLLLLAALPAAGPAKAEGETLPSDNNASAVGLQTYTSYIKAQTVSDAEGDAAQVTVPSAQSADTQTTDNFKDTGKSCAILTDTGFVEWTFSVPKEGLYQIYITYAAGSASSGDIEASAAIDGKTPFRELSALAFKRTYEQRGEIKTNVAGNDIKPDAVEIVRWSETGLQDASGYVAAPFRIALAAGSHTLRLTGVRGSLAVHSIRIAAPVEPMPYAAYLAQQKAAGRGTPQVPLAFVEGEKPTLKSDLSILPASDRSSPTTYPQSASAVKLNTLGGSSWKRVGESVTWTIQVKESGLYQIAPRFRQNILDGIFTSRRLLIDGEVPFKEAESLRFGYDANWQLEALGGAEPYLFYLEKGTHQLTLQVVMGDVAEVIGQVQASLTTLNEVYRKIIMIAGTSPDVYRDYNFKALSPEEIAEFGRQKALLQNVVDTIDAQTGTGGSYTSIIKKIVFQLGRMYDNPESIAKYLEQFKSNIGSLGTWLLSANEQPLQIDRIYIAPEGAALPAADAGFFSRLGFGVQCFISSFFTDYSAVGQTGDASYDQSLKVWIQTGRDQAEILRRLIDTGFSGQQKASVNLELVAQGTLLQSVLAGLGPDVVLNNPVSEPINYAVRNAVLDLTQFKDYAEVASWFHPAAVEPYTYKGKTYALPETFTFPMFFYRTDIFEELGLKEPESWDDIIEMIPNLQKKNLSMAFPKDINGYALLLYQNGGDLYINEGEKTNLKSNEALNSFVEFTEMFTLYDLPITYDFPNRFRSGEMPCGIQDYTMYNQLTVFAPEIKGLWKFIPVPGKKKADGTTENISVGTGMGDMILAGSRNPDLSWEFLKWWMSADVQSAFAKEMETILGPAAKQPTANMEALTKMTWSSAESRSLQQQLEHVRAVPEVPGGYYLTRVITFALNRVYNGSGTQNMAENPVEVLSEYVPELNDELRRKREEFGVK